MADGVANHEDHTIETQVEYVEQAFKSFNISCSGYTEDEMLSLTFWPQLYAKLDELDRVAQKIIQKEMPPDDPVVLKLTDIMLDTSGCYGAFALGYDMGELAFRNDGTIEVYYDDDDIFWGHCIIANIDAEGNPVHADIAG